MTKAKGSQNGRMMKEEASLSPSGGSCHSSLICHSTFGFRHFVGSWNPNARHSIPSYLKSLAMARYNYVALDARGQEATGLVEAASTNDAIGRLRQAGYFPTSVYEEAIARPDDKTARRQAAKMVRATKPRAKSGIVLFQRTKVKAKILR